VVFFLGIVTTFVIPVLVFEGKGIAGAVVRSLSVLKKTWVEIILCCLIFGLIAFAFGLVSLIPAVAIGFPSGSPVLIGASIGLYMLVLIIMIMVGSTAFGIVLVGLYDYVKTGRLPEAFLAASGTGQ
jgi:hypothetical protein